MSKKINVVAKLKVHTEQADRFRKAVVTVCDEIRKDTRWSLDNILWEHTENEQPTFDVIHHWSFQNDVMSEAKSYLQGIGPKLPQDIIKELEASVVGEELWFLFSEDY